MVSLECCIDVFVGTALFLFDFKANIILALHAISKKVLIMLSVDVE